MLGVFENQLFAFPRVPWSSLELPGVLWSSLEFSGVPWSSLEFSGVPWSSLEFPGVLWSSLEFPGALWSSLEFPVWPGNEWRFLPLIEIALGQWKAFVVVYLIEGHDHCDWIRQHYHDHVYFMFAFTVCHLQL